MPTNTSKVYYKYQHEVGQDLHVTFKRLIDGSWELIPRLYTRPTDVLRRLSQTKVWGRHEVTEL